MRGQLSAASQQRVKRVVSPALRASARPRIAMHPGASVGGPYVTSLAESLNLIGWEVVAPGIRPLVSGEVDVLHVHWPEQLFRHSARTATLWLAAIGAAKARGTKVVMTVHNLAPHDPQPMQSRRGIRALERLCDGLVLHGEDSLDLLAQRRRSLAMKPSVVAPHGDLRIHGELPDRAEARAALGLTNSQFVLLAAGAIRSYKQLPGLAEAFHGAAFGPNIAMIIAGRPADAADTKALHRAASASLRFRPERLSDAELLMMVAASDAMVSNYSEIHTSGAAHLALSYGRPFLGPSIGLLPEMRRQYGSAVRLFEPPLDAAKLRAAVSDLLTVRKHEAALPSWAASAANHAELYERLLRRSIWRRRPS